MKKLRQLTVRQWARLRFDVEATTTEPAREKAQEKFERLRMRHFGVGNTVPDPIGCWREELQCPACGVCQIVGTQYLPPSIMQKASKTAPICKGVFNGRPRGRCGWRMSRVWLLVPDNPL